MDSVSLKFAVGFEGMLVGTAANPDLESPVARQAVLTSLSGSTGQVYLAWPTPLTVAAGATTTLNLSTGLTNPLNEAIGSAPFAHVYGVLVQHDSASAASTVTVFNAAANSFQGPRSAGSSDALGPGMWTGFGVPADKTAWAVDGTHKNVAITNNDGGHAATVNVIILGTTT